MITYQIYHNLDSHYMRPYQPGDRLATGHQAGLPSAYPGESSVALAEQIYAKHNRDNRPDGQAAPSLSVGDVVVIGEMAMSVDRCGFAHVDLQRSDLLGLTYMESRDLW
jgi:hypothetical protein